MKSNRRWGLALIGVGAALLAAALLLLLNNRAEDADAEKAANEALSAIQTAIDQYESSQWEGAQAKEDAAADKEQKKDSGKDEKAAEKVAGKAAEKAAEKVDDQSLPTLPLDGHDYLGYLSISDLGVNLPVMVFTGMGDLQVAPCLERGNPGSNDAVIAAHNYSSHFGRLKELSGGEDVVFTDLYGECTDYTVGEVRTIAPTDVDLVYESDYDLVLYTCTPGGQSRVMVGCNRVAAVDKKE